MAHYLLDARNIYTKLIQDNTLTNKQKEDITYYGLLTVNIAGAEISGKDGSTSSKKDNDEAMNSIYTALDYFKVPYSANKGVKHEEEEEIKPKIAGGFRYTSGGNIFVFEDALQASLDEQKIALDLFPKSYKGSALIKKFKEEFKISMSDLLMMNLTEYLTYFMKHTFKDIYIKGIKHHTALLAEKYHGKNHKDFKRSNWHKLNVLVSKSLVSYPEPPVVPTLTTADKKKYRSILSKVKKTKNTTLFYKALYEMNVELKEYFSNYLRFLIATVKYLSQL